MESNPGHTSSEFVLNPISLNIVYFPVCEVTDLSRHHCTNPLTQNTTVYAAGIPPQKRPHTEASYLAPVKPPGMQLKPENQTASKLRLFHPAKNPQNQHKVLSTEYIIFIVYELT